MFLQKKVTNCAPMDWKIKRRAIWVWLPRFLTLLTYFSLLDWDLVYLLACLMWSLQSLWRQDCGKGSWEPCLVLGFSMALRSSSIGSTIVSASTTLAFSCSANVCPSSSKPLSLQVPTSSCATGFGLQTRNTRKQLRIKYDWSSKGDKLCKNSTNAPNRLNIKGTSWQLAIIQKLIKRRPWF